MEEYAKFTLTIVMYMLMMYLGTGVYVVTFAAARLFKNGPIRWEDLDLIDPWLRCKIICIVIVMWLPLLIQSWYE